MKKLYFSLTLCLMMFVVVAQRPSGTTTSFYFGGGPTFSKSTGDLADNAKILIGAQVALGMKWNLNNNFSVVPELNVSMQGSKFEGINGGNDVTHRIWFLNVPVTVRYQFGQSGFFAETGPQVGLVLDAKSVQDGQDNVDVSKSYKSTSIHWVAGVGYQLNNNLTVDARVAPGLTDFYKGFSGTSTKQFTSAVRLTFGF